MKSITDFLSDSNLICQLQDAILDTAEEYGPEGLESNKFKDTLVSFVSTVVIAYAISHIGTKATTSEDLQEILNNIIKEIAPNAKGTLVGISDEASEKALLDMYKTASANRLPC